MPVPAPAPNETIVEGELSLLNEEDMNCVVTLPPTPHKETADENHQEGEKEEAKAAGNCRGISTQILPLARLSSGNSPRTAEEEDAKPKKREESKEAEAATPVRDKLHRLRKSLAEPLLQYFQDLQEGGNEEEPTVLNTPKSVKEANRGNSGNGRSSLKARSLFKTKKAATASEEKEEEEKAERTYANMPPIIITDM